jgi:hypothetical protein
MACKREEIKVLDLLPTIEGIVRDHPATRIAIVMRLAKVDRFTAFKALKRLEKLHRIYTVKVPIVVDGEQYGNKTLYYTADFQKRTERCADICPGDCPACDRQPVYNEERP